jgi:hypothetical protein
MTKREIPQGLLSDPAWRAVLHILLSPLFADAAGVWSRVDMPGRTIDFEEILAGPWSGGELRMLKLAASLFNPRFTVALWSDLGGIDGENAAVLIEAMRLFTYDPIGEAT